MACQTLKTTPAEGMNELPWRAKADFRDSVRFSQKGVGDPVVPSDTAGLCYDIITPFTTEFSIRELTCYLTGFV